MLPAQQPVAHLFSKKKKKEEEEEEQTNGFILHEPVTLGSSSAYQRHKKSPSNYIPQKLENKALILHRRLLYRRVLLKRALIGMFGGIVERNSRQGRREASCQECQDRILGLHTRSVTKFLAWT
jgi:hypothetical protein